MFDCIEKDRVAAAFSCIRKGHVMLKRGALICIVAVSVLISGEICSAWDGETLFGSNNVEYGFLWWAVHSPYYN